ncbi:MAG: o-succinylbenzoate synthase, partial [Actinomycetota bacterium]
MKIETVELRRIRMPLRGAFRTSFGVETVRDILLVHVLTPDAEGWGECVAGSEPLYSSEYVDGAQEVIRRFLLPMLFEADSNGAASVASVLEPVNGHRMAKAAV